MQRNSLCALAAIAATCLLGTLFPAHATIDATLNTTNFVSGQASELSVDGVISQGGTSTSINCAVLMIRFNPAKVTLSGVRSGSNGWGLAASNTTQLSAGWMKAILNNSSGDAGQGQTSTGPVMYFTVTPVDSSVNVNDCATLQLTGSESDLSDQDYETITPSDPCNGIYAPSGGPEVPVITGATDTGAGPLTLSMPDQCQIENATRALKVAGGLLASDCGDMQTLDADLDGKITIMDAVQLLRIPCSAFPVGWYTFQGDRSRTGRTCAPIDLSVSNGNPLWEKDLVLPAGFTPMNEMASLGITFQPSPVVVPNPVDPSRRLIYVVAYAYDSVTLDLTSFLFRIEEMLNGTQSVTRTQLFADLADTKPAIITSTPLVVSNKVFLSGYYNTPEYTTAYIVVEIHGSSLQRGWVRPLPGKTMGSLGWSPYATQYTLNTSEETHSGGSVLVACDADYTYQNPARVDSNTGFLFALDPDNGHHVWGNVDASGNLVTAPYGPLSTPHHRYVSGEPPVYGAPDTGSAGGGETQFSGTSPGGLPPLAYGVTQSSPSSDGAVAYVQDISCYVNARDLTTGGFLWDNHRFDDRVESSVSVQNGQLYFTGSASNAVSMVAGRNGGQEKWFLNGDYYNGVPINSNITDAWSTPAILKERSLVILSDISGRLFQVFKDAEDPQYPTVFSQAVETANSYSSPLLAPGTVPDTFTVYLTGADRQIHVLDADSLSPVGPGTLGDPNGVFGDGLLNSPVDSSLAAWDGRLFVVTQTPAYPPPGLNPPQPWARLLCYGR